MSDTFEVGDKVRITFEAEVTFVDFDDEVYVEDDNGNAFSFFPENVGDGLKVEKFVPPFHVGDLVGAAGMKFLLLEDLGEDGEFKYLSLQTSNVYNGRFDDKYTVLSKNFGITEDAA